MSYTDGWKPDNAQKEMEQILTKNNNKVDAVVAENDGMAGGVVAALTAQGLAGVVPVSGQDGDHANDQPGRARHPDRRRSGRTAATSARRRARRPSRSRARQEDDGHRWREALLGRTQRASRSTASCLTPLAVTKDNLNVIVDKGWITKAEVCAGVKPEMTPYLQVS